MFCINQVCSSFKLLTSFNPLHTHVQHIFALDSCTALGIRQSKYHGYRDSENDDKTVEKSNYRTDERKENKTKYMLLDHLMTKNNNHMIWAPQRNGKMQRRTGVVGVLNLHMGRAAKEEELTLQNDIPI